MPEFAYTARTLNGQRVNGSLAAGNEREALAALAAKELFPISVTADPEAIKVAQSGQGVKVKPAVVAPVYSQLAALLRSGVPLLRSLQVLEEQSSNKNLQHVLGDVRERVEEGQTLSEAMSRNPKAFDELSVSIIRAGGEGGFLEEALERVARFAEQSGELKARVMGALAYPMVLCTIGTLIVVGLLIFVVPSFKDLFTTLQEQGELPSVTIAMLAISDTFRSVWGIVVVGILFALGVLLKKYVNTPEGRLRLDQWRIKAPMAGSIYLSLAVARFCRVLGTLLNGGVPIVKSLDISADATGNRVLQEAVRDASENITAGQSLAVPLGESGHFPRNVVEMIAVAEQSNSLETVLTQIADNLEKQTWRKLDLAVRLLEPLLLVVLAIIVLLVVMALLLPVIKMGGTMS